MNVFKTAKRTLALGLALAAISTGAVYAQPASDITLVVQNSGSGPDFGRDTLRWGVNPSGTNNRDASLGEDEQPPAPPSGVFDIRFTNIGTSTDFGEGTKKNYHQSTGSATQRDTFQIRVQPGDGGYPVTISWPSLSSYWGGATLRYVDADGNAQLVNMLTSTSVTFTSDGSPTNVRIFTLNPMAPASGVSASPSPLAFGTVAPAMRDTMTLTISNTGATSVSIDSVRSSDSNFHILTPPTFPQTVAASGTVNVPVEFVADSSASGAFSSTIRVYHSVSGSPLTVSATANVSSGEGLYWNEVTNRVMDNRAGLYSEYIGLKYTGGATGHPMQGLQFRIKTTNNTIKITSVQLVNNCGAASSTTDWSFDYELSNAASGSEATVVLYGADSTINFLGQCDSLFRVNYDVKNINTCGGTAGCDSVTSLAYISEVESSINDNLGTPAGVATDADRDTTNFYVYNTSARGDVNCDDHVDILDVLETIDHILGRHTLAPWQINRVDLAPWADSTWGSGEGNGAIFCDQNNYGDGEVNVQDVTLLVNAILNEAWPDQLQLSRTERGDDFKGDEDRAVAGAYDVKFNFTVANKGVRVQMLNLVGVKGIQIWLKSNEAPADLQAQLAQAFRESNFTLSYKVEGDEIHILIYSLSGNVVPESSNPIDLVNLPYSIVAPREGAVSVIEPITVGDAANKPVKVEYEFFYEISSVANQTAVASFSLINSPNPFNGSTKIEYNLPNGSNVSLVVLNEQGVEVARLVDGRQMAGNHSAEFSGATVPAGTYYYTLTVGGVKATRKMVLVK